MRHLVRKGGMGYVNLLELMTAIIKNAVQVLLITPPPSTMPAMNIRDEPCRQATKIMILFYSYEII